MNISASLLLAGVLALVSLSPEQARGQAPPPGPIDSRQNAEAATLTEVVVTAQRRPESLQSVPVSVTALSAETLRSAGVSGLDTLDVAIPALNIQNGVGYLATHLRGVGSVAIGAGIENPVALYVDGVYYANQTAGLFEFNNISQIEVLKGPQGTLFGRNSTGGLIQLTTLDPTQEFKLRASLAPSNYRGLDGSAYLSSGIASDLAADVAIRGSRRDGYGTNIATGQDVYAEPHDFALRSKWIYSPEAWKITFIADYADTDSSDNPETLVPGSYAIRGLTPQTFYGNPWDANTDVQPRLTLQAGGVSLKAEHDVGLFSVSNLAAARSSTFKDRFDDDGSPLPLSAVSIVQRDWQITDELQLASHEGSRLQWVAGMFYFQDASRYAPTQLTFSSNPLFNPGFPLGSISDIARQTSHAISGYAQATYSLNERLKLTAGLRYSHERRALDAHVNGQLLVPGNPTIPLIPPLGREESFSDPTYRLALDYSLAEDLLVYASFNTGFKSGGFNASSPTDPGFAPEKLNAWEIGEKVEFLDHRVRFNSAFFYYKYQNIQEEKPEATGTGIINGARATLYGFDGELTAKPINQLQLGAGLTWLHTKFDSFPVAPVSTPGGGVPTGVGDVTGNRLPYAPSAVLNASATWSPTTSIAFNVIYYHSAQFFFEPDNVLSQGSFNKVNASLLWTSPDRRYSVRVFGNNLSNTAVVSSAITEPAGQQLQSLEPPRIYGVAFAVDY